MTAPITMQGRGPHAAPAGAGYIVANVVTGLVTPFRAPRGAWTRRLVPAWRRFAPWAPLVLAAIAAAMVLVDAPMMRAAESLPRDVLDGFNEITDFGRGVWPLTPLFVLLLTTPILDMPRLPLMARGVVTAAAIRLGYMFLAIGLTGLADTIVKRIIGRVRPSDFGPFAYRPLRWKSEFASMPSGHATTVFATLVAVGLVFPRARPLLWVYALVIAVSRIVVLAHYTSDVIAGAAFGAFGAIVVRDWFAARRLGFYVDRDGRVQTMPGPSLHRLMRVAAQLVGR
jgi:undecaprenyl-diphosphatase